MSQEQTKIPKVVKRERRKLLFKPSKKFMIIALWIVAIAAIGILSFTVSRNNALAPNKVAEASLEALKNNDDTRLYSLGSDDFRKASDQAEVKSVVTQWNKVISQATNGKPQLVSKQTYTENDKTLTALVYKYDVEEGKSKIGQKELFVRIVLEKIGSDYKLHTFNIDPKKKDDNKNK